MSVVKALLKSRAFSTEASCVTGIIGISITKDHVIDVIDIATLTVADHIPTGASPEMFELSRDEQTLYVSNPTSAVWPEKRSFISALIF